MIGHDLPVPTPLMRARREVPKNPPVAAHSFRLLLYKHHSPVSPLECAITRFLTTVLSKRLTEPAKSFRIRTYKKVQGGGPALNRISRPRFTPKGTSRGPLTFLSAALLFVASPFSTKAQEASLPTAEQLATITERGRALYEYDQAAWHASDAVQMSNPSNVEGQRYIAKKENGKWTVVFGKLSEDRNRFLISYEADEQATLRQFTVRQEPASRQDDGSFLYAARAIEAAMKDLGAANRPYNVAVLPAPAEQLYVYLYPAQTKARVYPLGGDVRYLVGADGTKILEKHQMHKSIIETAFPPGKKVVSGFHTHVLSDLPEDTDVFHVLSQDPPLPEFVATPHFTYQVKTDGTIQMEEKRKRKK